MSDIMNSSVGGMSAMKARQGRRVGSGDIYEWAMYELSCARRVELSSGIDTSDLRDQIVLMLQKDLYEWMGDDLTI